MSSDARIGDPHVRAGLVAGDGGLIAWPLLLPLNVVKELYIPTRSCIRKNSRCRRGALIHKKCNLDRRIVAVCCPELQRVRRVIVRGSTAPPAQAIQ